MSSMNFSLSTRLLELELGAAGSQLRLRRLAGPGGSWLDSLSPSGLFSVTTGGGRFTARELQFQSGTLETEAGGVQRCVMRFAGPNLEVTHTLKLYPDSALLEMFPLVRNTGPTPMTVTALDSFSLDIPPAGYQLFSLSSDWGAEFEPEWAALDGERVLETRSGRSSKGMHPWFALLAGPVHAQHSLAGRVLSGAVAWSGNWIFRFHPLAGGGFRLSGGLNDWNFSKELAPRATLEGPPCILVLGQDLNQVSRQYARVGRRFWYPKNALSAALPVEWNGWWSYEDLEINEEVFCQNLAAAACLGLELCTLDAGWFGPDEAGAGWHDFRGDWQQVNHLRFPSGLRPLADAAHARGQRFGLWCEIEGLGKDARLAADHPDFPARREGAALGYVCLGNPAAREWAFVTIAGLIEQYDCDWIKLDFNVDPGAGCDRTDHGHGVGDGLYEHIRGYYGLLDRLRSAYPQVVLEACSSGGLRIDLGLARRTHIAFLSDPDWPVHSLQIFWGASLMLAPNALLHWSFSQWRGKSRPPPQQSFDPHDPALTRRRLDYYTRIAMLGQMGFSQKLPDLPPWVSARLAYHVRVYKEHVRPFVLSADLYRLTSQPLRSGGERWCAFQYSLPAADQHLLFVFRLPGAAPARILYPLALQPGRLYTVQGLEGEFSQRRSGQDLMANGLLFDSLEEEDSTLLLLM